MDGKNNKEKLITFDEITSLLSGGDFYKFITLRETEFFEAKLKKPYSFPQKKAITELAKDVASFANNKGGFIVCGLTTEKRYNSPHDYIVSLDLGKKDDFYQEKQLTGLIISNIHPRLDVKVKWYPSKSDSSVGLGVIIILPQDEAKKYFLIRTLEIGGNSTREFFGVPIRTDDDTKWLTAQELHKLSKRSPNNLQELHQSLTTQLDELKGLVLTTGAMSVNIDSIPAKIDETIYGS